MVPRETRSKPFKVNLTPTMHERLCAVAERLGMAPSAVACMAIAEYVAKQSGAVEIQNVAVEKLVELMAPQMGALFETLAKEEQKEK